MLTIAFVVAVVETGVALFVVVVFVVVRSEQQLGLIL